MTAADGYAPTTDEHSTDLVQIRPHPRVRARTESVRRLARRDLDRGRMMYPADEHASYERPQTRGDCLPGGCNEQRPCPWVSCRYHLAVDVNPVNGNIKTTYPDVELEDLPDTCSLDVAARGGLTLEEVGEVMNITRERTRQLEASGKAKLALVEMMATLAELVEGVSPVTDATAPGAGPRSTAEALDAIMGHGHAKRGDL